MVITVGNSLRKQSLPATTDSAGGAEYWRNVRRGGLFFLVGVGFATTDRPKFSKYLK